VRCPGWEFAAPVTTVWMPAPWSITTVRTR
jgi:hypothetical protein